MKKELIVNHVVICVRLVSNQINVLIAYKIESETTVIAQPELMIMD